MVDSIKSRWLLFILLAVFITVKIPVLHYPFFWDESWSYAPAVKQMYTGGISLVPNSIGLLSRGHPLLFYAAAASWMKIFGDSHISQHSFALFISVLLLITLYEACLRLFNNRVAILSALLVSVQVMFFVQSTLLLPEIMVTWLSILTLYLYVKDKYVLTFISCSALMLTKESGMTLGLVLGVCSVCNFFIGTQISAKKIKSFLPVLCAGLVTGFFFLAQKKINGWYLAPMHTSLINLQWSMFKGIMRYCAEIIFCHQYRIYLFVLLLVFAIVATIVKKNVRYLLPVLLGILLYIFINEQFGYLTRRLFIPGIFAGLIYTLHVFIQMNRSVSKQGTKFIYLALLFLGAYLSFTSINFFTNRYLMCGLTVVLILAAWCFDFLVMSIHIRMYYVLVVAIAVITFFAFKRNKGIGDVDLGTYDAMVVQENIVTYFEQHNLYNQPIFSTSFLEREHLSKPSTGFLHSDKIFCKVSDTLTSATQYIIIDNIELGTLKEPARPANDYSQVYRISEGDTWAEVWLKMQKIY